MAAEPAFDPTTDYPLGERRPDLIVGATGKGSDAFTLDAVAAGDVTGEDLRIAPQVLEWQAEIAAAHGRPQLGPNLRRAAELTRVDDARLLQIYEALRPRRSTADELTAIASELQSEYDAPETAALIREAIVAYHRRGLLRDPGGA